MDFLLHFLVNLNDFCIRRAVFLHQENLMFKVPDDIIEILLHLVQRIFQRFFQRLVINTDGYVCIDTAAATRWFAAFAKAVITTNKPKPGMSIAFCICLTACMDFPVFQKLLRLLMIKYNCTFRKINQLRTIFTNRFIGSGTRINNKFFTKFSNQCVMFVCWNAPIPAFMCRTSSTRSTTSTATHR